MLTVAELITILQKSGLKVPKKFKLVYEDQDQEQGGKEKKKSKRSNDDHLAALAEADLAAGVSGDVRGFFHRTFGFYSFVGSPVSLVRVNLDLLNFWAPFGFPCLWFQSNWLPGRNE
jgi:hypothetical protein